MVSACDPARTEVFPGMGRSTEAGMGGSGGAVGMGGGDETGGTTGGTDAMGVAADAPAAEAAPGRPDLVALGSGGAGGAVVPATGGATAASTDGSVTSASGGAGAAGGSGGRDAPAPGGAGGTGGYTDNPAPDGPLGTGGKISDSCDPPPPNGYHTIHFRYPWAGQRTFTLFPKPELMPESLELRVDALCNSVTCRREQDRPWFNCPVPDSYFVPEAGWLVVDTTRSPEWNTLVDRPMPTTAKDYWLRWLYGRPDVARDQYPPNFEFLEHYPDAAAGNWAALGQWNDAMCALKPPASPVTIGFNQDGWFPYKSTDHKYPFGASLASVYPDTAKAQDALDAFAFERYNLWKNNWVKHDADACGTGTARVRSDIPPGTVSEGQGYGIAMSAAIGDKELFDKLWTFVRHYRSQAKYCGLMGWMWQGTADCQPIDSFATTGGNHDSAFDGDVDIGIGLVYAALQWPEYTAAATDWLVRMECEVNAKYGDGWNYPTVGDSWDKNCRSATTCDYDPGTISRVYNDYYPPGYFRVFGDFLAVKLGADAAAANGQTHRDFWYKTAGTVYELVERCYDEKGVHPGLIGNGGDILRPCQEIGSGEPYEWARALWRIGIDAAWFGNDISLPENAPGSSKHYADKSRMRAKIDNIQGFYSEFFKTNPPEPGANRFSSLCHQLTPAGTVVDCNPTNGHNSYTVNMAMCSFASAYDNGGATTSSIRREALEESVSTTVLNEHYFEESLGVYSILFLTGNFPNPMTVPTK
jgi:hypothetical protein